jgi:hypothetical protein
MCVYVHIDLNAHVSIYTYKLIYMYIYIYKYKYIIFILKRWLKLPSDIPIDVPKAIASKRHNKFEVMTLSIAAWVYL